jgi:hypothetical protein
LTFSYDPDLLPAGVAPAELLILHYVDGGWETLAPIALDAGAHTLTVQTDSLSPFVLGAVPEPATLGLLAVGAVAMIHRRRTA